MKYVLSCILLVVFLFCIVTPATADSLVGPAAWFSPTNPDDEEAWLEGLLGLTYDDPTVEFIQKDETDDPLDVVPSSWTYAVLKYGNGKPAEDNPDHWAIMDDGDFILQLGDISGLPDLGRLSHVSYFSGPRSVPEPSSIMLLGLGLIGLASFGRIKLKK